jgi:hypothetical protein
MPAPQTFRIFAADRKEGAHGGTRGSPVLNAIAQIRGEKVQPKYSTD